MTGHTMNLVKTYFSGAEEWICDKCSQQIILQWRPYNKIILSEDNFEILHSFSKGGLQVNGEVSESMDDDLRSQVDDVLANL